MIVLGFLIYDVMSDFKHCLLVFEVLKYQGVHLDPNVKAFVKDGSQGVVEYLGCMLACWELLLEITILFKDGSNDYYVQACFEDLSEDPSAISLISILSN